MLESSVDSSVDSVKSSVEHCDTVESSGEHCGAANSSGHVILMLDYCVDEGDL